MLNSQLLTIIKNLYSIPNAPYSLESRSLYIKSYIKSKGFEYTETPYYISTSLGNHNTDSKIVIISHLDHPGFVFKNNQEATAFGSLYLHKVKKFKEISVYDPKGNFLGNVEIQKVYGEDERSIKVKSNFHIPKNSQGLWNTGEVFVDSHKIYGRSHDNDITTAIMLYNLRKPQSTKYNITYLFTKHEEILQQSSYNISKNNSLIITPNDIVINLESMKVYPTTEILKYSNLNYTDGPVLNISETTKVYATNKQNQAESMINNIAQERKLDLQRGLAGGTSDARHISSFNLTKNIVTLNIPNRYKHNSNGKQIVQEEVLIKDVNTVSEIICAIVDSKEVETSPNIEDISMSITENIKMKIEKTSYTRINRRLDISNRHIIVRGYYYPITIIDYLCDLFLKIISYIVFYTQPIEKTSKVSKR